MADSKISALTAATTVADTDMFVLATAAAATKKVTGANLRSEIRTGGGGDAASMYVATTGTIVDFKRGTSSSADTSVHPVLKATRSISITRGSVSGDGGEQCAAILGVSAPADTSNQVQTVGVYGAAKNTGTSNGGSGGVDACGIYGASDITGSGVGTGIGGFFNGRRSTNTGKACGVEISVDNNTATAVSFSTSGFANATGAWVHATGTSQSGVGIAFGNPFNVQLDVGIGFTSQGTGGPILTSSIQDESSAATSILINGTHSTAAIAVKAGSGTVMFGGTSTLTSSTARLEVQGSASASIDPVLFIGNTSGSFSHAIQIRNSVGVPKIAVCGATNSFFTGTSAGDLAIFNTTGSKSVHLGGGASVIQVTNASALGFFQTTPIAQYSTTGTSTGFTAGGGTTATHLSTFTGNTGSTAYTVGDIVRALKLYGLMLA